MAYRLGYSRYAGAVPTDAAPVPDDEYRLAYSDYSTTTEGPPDPARWTGPPGPQGEPGPKGDKGDTGAAGGGYTLPVASTTVLGGVKIDNATIHIDGSGVISAAASGVTSFNTRTGAITLVSADVTTALTFTPYNVTNPAAYVNAAGAAAAAPVQSVSGRTGAITLTKTDVGLANVDNTSDIAKPISTATQTALNLKYDASNPSGYQTAAQVSTSLAPYAPLASPPLSGTPTAPTATAGTNTTQLATTAFVAAAVAGGTAGVASFNSRVGIVTLSNADVTAVLAPSSTTPVMDGTATIGVGTTWARADHVHPSDTSRLALTGGNLSGNLGVIPSGNATLTVGSATSGNSNISINGATGVNRGITWLNANTNRWFMAANGAEGGSNAGSNLLLIRYDDTGTNLGNTLSITRSTGLMTVAADPTAALGVATKQYADKMLPLAGVTNGSDAPAGQVGEYQAGSVGGGALPSATPSNVASLSLPAGDWDVWARANVSATGTPNVSAVVFAVSTVSGAMPGGGDLGGLFQMQAPFTVGGTQIVNTGMARISISATTTVFAVCQVNFTAAGSCTVNGQIFARRAR